MRVSKSLLEKFDYFHHDSTWCSARGRNTYIITLHSFDKDKWVELKYAPNCVDEYRTDVEFIRSFFEGTFEQ